MGVNVSCGWCSCHLEAQRFNIVTQFSSKVTQEQPDMIWLIILLTIKLKQLALIEPVVKSLRDCKLVKIETFVKTMQAFRKPI